MRLGEEKRHRLQAAQIVAISFAAVIFCGTILLLLPVSSASGESCGLMTALFTATSATCVTGLVLVDTLTAWSFFGQAVILIMIQLGGLGFMTIIFLLSLLVRRKLSLSQRLMMVSAFNLNDMSDVTRLLHGALRTTFAVEGAGAIILTACFLPRYGAAAVWKGIFISASAFCNAGFDLLGPAGIGSLSSYDGNPIVLITAAVLITAGGLGFFVWEEIKEKRAVRTLTLYSKIVLYMTGALLLLGTVFFFAAEFRNGGTLGEMPVWKRLLNAFFQSATLRTAGFYSFDQGGMTDVSMVMSILLMLIGGSSGSTAGGLKIGTISVILLATRAGLRGSETVTFRGRTIPQQKVLSAVTLVLFVLLMFITASMAVALIDGVPYLAAAYEAASAMATVGLTTGITAGLSRATHILLILLMYLGRVGVLSFSLAFLSQSRGRSKLSYPKADVMIG